MLALHESRVKRDKSANRVDITLVTSFTASLQWKKMPDMLQILCFNIVEIK